MLQSPEQRLERLRHFKRKVPVIVESDKFIAKTVETWEELEKALRLRYDVYYRELGADIKDTQFDTDEFDPVADHATVFSRETGEAIGTYRLISSTFSDKFYSASEFDISRIAALSGSKCELGRACVRKDQRGGIVVILLWRLVSSFLVATRARYLFGCSSVGTTNLDEIGRCYALLNRYHKAPDDMRVSPVEAYRIPDIDRIREAADARLGEIDNPERVVQQDIPPLFHFYLKVGAMVCGDPALDKAFKCTDFFTLLDIDQIPPPIKKKYGLC